MSYSVVHKKLNIEREGQSERTCNHERKRTHQTESDGTGRREKIAPKGSGKEAKDKRKACEADLEELSPDRSCRVGIQAERQTEQ